MRGTVTQLGELERGVIIEGDHHDNKVQKVYGQKTLKAPDLA